MTLDQNNANTSIVEINGMVLELYGGSYGFYWLISNFSVNGNISSSILPSGLSLILEGSIPLIASENVMSPLALEMLLTDLGSRYAEGLFTSVSLNDFLYWYVELGAFIIF